MYNQVRRNKRRTTLLFGVFTLVTFAVFETLSYEFTLGIAGTVLAAITAVTGATLSYWASDKVALAISRARLTSPEKYARLHNLVEGLCIAGALPKPRIYVIDDPAPNAFATGRNPNHASIAVTTGLLEKMNRTELEGVLAHELAHIKRYDILISTLTVTMVGMIDMASDLSSRTRRGNTGRRNDYDQSTDDDWNDSTLGLTLAIFGFTLLMIALCSPNSGNLR